MIFQVFEYFYKYIVAIPFKYAILAPSRKNRLISSSNVQIFVHFVFLISAPQKRVREHFHNTFGEYFECTRKYKN